MKRMLQDIPQKEIGKRLSMSQSAISQPSSEWEGFKRPYRTLSAIEVKALGLLCLFRSRWAPTRPNVPVLKIFRCERANPAKNLATQHNLWRELRTWHYRPLPPFTVLYRGLPFLIPPNIPSPFLALNSVHSAKAIRSRFNPSVTIALTA